MAITAARFNLFADRICQAYERMRGGSSYGIGVVGDTTYSYGALDDLMDDIVATADSACIGGLYNTAKSARDSTYAQRIALRQMQGILERLNGLVRAASIDSTITNIETWLAYYNTGTGGDWNALMPGPQWREIYYQWKGAYPSVSNLYFEIKEAGTFRGTTYTNALGKFVVSGAGAGTYTDGAAVDTTKYAGGVGNLKVSGLAGSGNVTITGTGWDPATGAITASVTWITAVSGDGNTAIVVGAGTAPAGCLINNVTNITIAAGITAGTIYAEALKPTGREAIP
jgi:hypothetical protein